MHGYLLIADISGYTFFLTSSELEHAQDILGSLMGMLTTQVERGMVIYKLVGDAVLGYAVQNKIQNGQTLLVWVDCIYCSFRKTRENMHLSTTCTCKACANIPTLDLKFFVHYGEYLLADIAGRQELSGPDVILVHRLLKNESSKQADLHAYVMFTQAALQAMQMDEFAAGLIHSQETYEHLGEIGVCLHELHAVWERQRGQHRVFITPEQAELVIPIEIPVSQAVAWDLMTNPVTRREILEASSMPVSGRQGGRIQAGATFHCVHHAGETPQFILDWAPVEYITTQDTVMKLLGATIQVIFTVWCQPTEAGKTRMVFALSGPKSSQPAVQPVITLLWRTMMRAQFQKVFETKMAGALQKLADERAHV